MVPGDFGSLAMLSFIRAMDVVEEGHYPYYGRGERWEVLNVMHTKLLTALQFCIYRFNVMVK